MEDFSDIERKQLPDHDRRMDAARNRAGWELGYRSWAATIINAYLDPATDATALDREMGGSDEGSDVTHRARPSS